jgi:hypothetical protein
MGEIPTPVWVRHLNSYGRADGETLKWCSIKQKRQFGIKENALLRQAAERKI